MTIQPERVIHVDFALVVVALLFVCLRLYVRIIVVRKFSAADVLVVIAWCCYLGDSFVDWFTHKCGMWDPRLTFKSDGKIPDYNGVVKDHAKLKNGLIVMYAVQPLYVIELYSIKGAFLMLYHELFPLSMTRLRKALYFTAGLVVLGVLSITGLNIFWCLPITRNWTMDPTQRCLAWAAAKPYYYSASLNISTDLLVYALPFFLLPTLRFATTKKLLGLVFIFSLGLFCIACTICRILMSDYSADTATVGLWYSVEQFCSITVVCLPPLKSLWIYERNIRGSRSASFPSERRTKLRRYIEVIGYWGRKIMPSFSTFSSQNSNSDNYKISAEVEKGMPSGSNATTTMGEWTVDGTVDMSTAHVLVNGNVVGGLAPRQKKAEDVDVVEEPASTDVDGIQAVLPPYAEGATSEGVEVQEKDVTDEAPTPKPTTRPRIWRKISIKLDTSVSAASTFGGINASASRSGRSMRSFSFSRNPPSIVASPSDPLPAPPQVSFDTSLQPDRCSSSPAVVGSTVVEEQQLPPAIYALARAEERGSFASFQAHQARFSAGNLSAFGGRGVGASDSFGSRHSTENDRERERSRCTTSSHGADSAGDDVRGSVGR